MHVRSEASQCHVERLAQGNSDAAVIAAVDAQGIFTTFTCALNSDSAVNLNKQVTIV